MLLYYIKNKQFEFRENRRGKCPYEISTKEVKEETSRSYIVDYKEKVNKKKLTSTDSLNGYITQYYRSKEEAEKMLWLKLNEFNIISSLKRSKNYDLFRYIFNELKREMRIEEEVYDY